MNSVIAFGFGREALAQYAGILASIVLVGGLVVSGPSAALTLGVSRRIKKKDPGVLPGHYLRFVLLLTVGFCFLIPPFFWLLEIDPTFPVLLWAGGAFLYAIYQLLRAFGYAVDRSDLVTLSELVGAFIPLLIALPMMIVRPAELTTALVATYCLGLVGFSASFTFSLRHRFHIDRTPIELSEKHLAIRESIIFFVGVGSSTAMQFLPTIIASRFESGALAAILFGAITATAPLLLLSRVYGAIMMPSLAGTAEEGGIRAHMAAVDALFIPSLAVALGLAPWVVLSLNETVDPFTTMTASMIALMTLFQVWATPAVTVLSARHREIVPALASLGGLAVASLFWAAAINLDLPPLLALGICAGGLVRSLVPEWIASGKQTGRIDRKHVERLFASMALTALIVAASHAPAPLALGTGALMVAAGAVSILRRSIRKTISIDDLAIRG